MILVVAFFFAVVFFIAMVVGIFIVTFFFVVTVVVTVFFAVLVIVMGQLAVVRRSVGYADTSKDGDTEEKSDKGPYPLHVGTAGVVMTDRVGFVRIVGGGHSFRVAKDTFHVAAQPDSWHTLSTMTPPIPSAEAIVALAPTGTLRAAINLSNSLLVSGADEDGRPVGVSPGIATALAAALGVGIELIAFPSPGSVADAVTEGGWDIGNIGAEPARAEHIDFTAAYAEIEATTMVRAESNMVTFDDVDQRGIRIAVKARAAYCLWLERNLVNAELVQFSGNDDAAEAFETDESLDAFAGLRTLLHQQSATLEGTRILEGRFTAVQQAIGTPKNREDAGFDYLEQFVSYATSTGVVAELIEHHQADGLLVAGA